MKYLIFVFTLAISSVISPSKQTVYIKQECSCITTEKAIQVIMLAKEAVKESREMRSKCYGDRKRD